MTAGAERRLPEDRPTLTGRRVTLRPGRFRPVGVMRQYERGSDGSFHDGLLMDLLRDELTSDW